MRDVKDIQWIKFAMLLKERYGYLLNGDLALRITKDSKEFVRAETEQA